MGKRKISFGNRGSPKKKKFKKEEIFNPEDSVKKYNQLLKAKSAAGELKRCKGKTELSWEGELPIAFGFGNTGLAFTIFITFYKSSRCPDFSVKEYPKLIYREELSTLFKQWKKWKPENKLRLFLDAIQRGCQNCEYDKRKDFSPSARKWTTDLYEFIKKSKISKWFMNIKEGETRVRFYIKLERIKKVWDAPYFCLSFGSEDTSYDPNDRIQFTKSCPEKIKDQKNYSDCRSPREAVKKIIQLLYKQQRIKCRSGDLVDYMALRIQKEFKALILEKSENKFVFLHKPGNEGSLNLGLTFKLVFQQESLTTFRFFLQQQSILQGKFGKAQGISWFWIKDWESKADNVIKWIRERIIQGDSIPFYRANQRINHRKLLQDGFKKHLFFKNNAKITSEKEQADIQSESTVPESPDPAKPVVKKDSKSAERYGESDTESAPEEKRSVTPPRPLKVPVPKASESPERESDF